MKLTPSAAGSIKQIRPTPNRYDGLFNDDPAGRAEEVIEFRSRSHTVERINALWRRAIEDFLTIGRWLVVAKDKLEYGEYEAMVRRDLPFSASRARQLRKVAEFVDSGRVPLEVLPPADSVIYEIATMTDDELKAIEPDIRPTMTRQEAQAFKKRSRAVEPPPQQVVLLDRRQTLLAELAKIEEELRAAGWSAQSG